MADSTTTDFASDSESNDPIVLVDPYAPRPVIGDDFAPDEDKMGHLDKLDTVATPSSSSDDSETPDEEKDGEAAADPALPAPEPVQKPVTDQEASDGEMSNAESRKKPAGEVGMETRHKKRRKTEESGEEARDQTQLRRMIRIEPDHP